MSTAPQVTRFAPSPTGRLHLGNARTALFNLPRRASERRALRPAHRGHGRRSAARSATSGNCSRTCAGWASSGTRARTSVARTAPTGRASAAAHYAPAIAPARRPQGSRTPASARPRNCTVAPHAARRRSSAAIRGHLRSAPPAARSRSAIAEGRAHAHRASACPTRAHRRVRRPDSRPAAIRDRRHRRLRRSPCGRQAAFFLGNAVDDAAMGVTLVLRGDDHLANTPRQILLLEALGLPVPRYGHLPLVLGAVGRTAVEARGRRQAARAARAGLPSRRALELSACASATPAAATSGSSRPRCRRTSTSRAPAARRRASTRRSCGTGSARP